MRWVVARQRAYAANVLLVAGALAGCGKSNGASAVGVSVGGSDGGHVGIDTAGGGGGQGATAPGGKAGSTTGGGTSDGGAGSSGAGRTSGTGAAPVDASSGNGAAGDPSGRAAGGTPPNGGAGVAASAGAAAIGGAGSGAMTPCTVTPTTTQSAVIPTVHTLTFTTTLTELTSAEVDFAAAAGGATMVAPVDLSQPDHKTILVGMKPNTNYVYRIKLSGAAGTCVSGDYVLTTGGLGGVPELTVTLTDPSHHDRGFLLVTSGLAGEGDGAYIIDPDGTVVWVPPDGAITFTTGRAHLSWNAARLTAMDVNYPKDNFGFIVSMAMDGTDVKSLSGVSAVHHDFVAIPGGIATLVWTTPNSGTSEGPSSVVEFLDSGESRTVVADTTTVLGAAATHTNSIHYYDSDHSYTLGDPKANAYAKVDRDGQLVWRFGGESPQDTSKAFAGVTPWQVNHGHHLTADGTFAFFNNTTSTAASNVFVYQLDTQNMQATPTASFTLPQSPEFGDVQRLPNGNFLLTASNAGVIEEVTPAGAVVMTIDAPPSLAFGYTEFRESLYGPPPY